MGIREDAFGGMDMPTSTRLPTGCAIAELATWSALTVAAITVESEILASVSAPTVLDCVSMYGYAVVSN